MESFEVTQKILAIGPTYEIRAQMSPQVWATVRGKVLTMTPKLTMVAGTEGPEIAAMTSNFFKTKFSMTLNGQLAGVLTFPFLALKKRFELTVGGQTYKADGSFFGGEFRCVDAQGNIVLSIAKQLALRDKFAVNTNGAIPREIALLAAVAIDQRFFQDNG